MTEAVRQYRALDDVVNTAYGEAHLGIVALGDGDPARAARHGQAARALADESGTWHPPATALLALGDAAHDAGEHRAAASVYADFLKLSLGERAPAACSPRSSVSPRPRRRWPCSPRAFQRSITAWTSVFASSVVNARPAAAASAFAGTGASAANFE